MKRALYPDPREPTLQDAFRPCPRCASRWVYWAKRSKRWTCKRCGHTWTDHRTRRIAKEIA